MFKTLYVSRHLENADQFLEWARGEGFPKVMDPEQLHVTIMYSKKEVEWTTWAPTRNKLKIVGGQRWVHKFGPEGNCAVLQFESGKLYQRHKEFLEHGCSFDYQTYKPHVTISHGAKDLDISNIRPYAGELIFGPEVFKEVDIQWQTKVKES